MTPSLAKYDTKARAAIMTFWSKREGSKQRQHEAGKADQGERAGVTSGQNMDGFLRLATDIVCANCSKGGQEQTRLRSPYT